MQNNMYVVFSRTPYTIGKIIRFFSHSEYNHVSVAFDRSLYEMYSFARYYKNAPFYGGFVRESAVRYFNGPKCAKVQVCKIGLTDAQLNNARAYLRQLETDKEAYRYNLISALIYPFKKRVNIDKCYTCVEFAVELLSRIGYDLGVEKGAFCSMKKLMGRLADKTIYVGRINKLLNNYLYQGDSFTENKGFRERTKLTLISNGKLIGKLFGKLFGKKTIKKQKVGR